MIKQPLFVLLIAAIGLTLVACGTQLDSLSAGSVTSPDNETKAAPRSDTDTISASGTTSEPESIAPRAQPAPIGSEGKETQSQFGLVTRAAATETDFYELESAAPHPHASAIPAQETTTESDMATTTAPIDAKLVSDSAEAPLPMNGNSESVAVSSVPNPVVEQGNELLDAAFGFTLPNALGSDQTLQSFHGDKNVVVVFYRAFW